MALTRLYPSDEKKKLPNINHISFFIAWRNFSNEQRMRKQSPATVEEGKPKAHQEGDVRLSVYPEPPMPLRDDRTGLGDVAS